MLNPTCIKVDMKRESVDSVTNVVPLLILILFLRKNGSATTKDLPRTDPDAHNFQEYTYKKITPCDVCSQILRGSALGGLAQLLPQLAEIIK